MKMKAFKHYGTVAALAVIILIFSILRPASFCTVKNFLNISRQAAPLAMVALGATFVMTINEFDLSIGNIVSLGGVIAALLSIKQVPVALCFLIAAVICLLVGCVNGIVKIAGIPFITLVAVVLYLAFYVFMGHTAPGRKLYAIGGNKEAAEVAGIPIFRYRVLAFSLCGAIAGLAGALVASRVGSANTTAGQGYFLQSYAAVFIGCTVSKSGVPCVVGTLIGAAVLAVLANGLTILQMPSFMQNIITGGIIILAVVIQKIGAGKN